MEWINLEAYEIFNLASKDILKSLDNPESKNNDKEITNFDNLESFLHNYGLNFKDLFTGKVVDMINDYFSDFTETSVELSKNQNINSKQFANNLTRIQEQFKKQDEKLYRDILNFKIKVDTFNKKNTLALIKNINKECDNIPKYILKKYLKFKNVISVDELVENTINNLQENYITTLYQLYNFNRGIHKDYTKLLNTGDPKVLKLNTNMFGIYRNFPEINNLNSKSSKLSPDNSVEDIINNWLKSSNDGGEYFFELLNYFDALNYKKNNINFITGTDKTPDEKNKRIIKSIRFSN